MAEIVVGRETIPFPPKFLEVMIDNMPYILTKKWECPDKIAVDGGWKLTVWAQLQPLALKALLRSTFSFTISAKKILILSQREQNEGKALATPKSGPAKKGVPWMGDAGRGGLGIAVNLRRILKDIFKIKLFFK